MPDEDLVSVTGGPLKPHEYILIKGDMTAGDEAWIQNHAAKSGGKGKEQEIIFCIGDVQLATAQRLIKGWSLSKTVTRHDGSKEQIPFPYSPANVEKLPVAIYKHVLKRINDLNPDDSEESGEGFLPSVVDSSEESFQAERVFQLKH